MIKKIILTVIISISLLTCSCPVFAQEANSGVDIYKNEIRRMYNHSVDSYRSIQEKIKEDNKNKRYEQIKEKIAKYYSTAVILEKQGKYTQAADCYKRVLSLTDDAQLKQYIEDKNSELKMLAEENRLLASKNLAEIKSREDERKKLRKLELKNEITKMRAKIIN